MATTNSYNVQCTPVNSMSMGHSKKDLVMKTSSYPMEIFLCKETMGQGPVESSS